MRANCSGIRIICCLATLLPVPVIAAACSSADPAVPIATDTTGAIADESPNPTALAPQQAATNQPATEDSNMTTILIIIGGQPVTAELTNNPTARDLAGQLPMTLTFRDLNQVEKIAKLPRPLSTDGVPEGDDPEVADIGYYAPSQDLVLYYGDVGYWNGIVRIGQFDSDQVDFVERQPDGFEVTVETA